MGDRIKFVLNTSADYFNTTLQSSDNMIVSDFFENDEIPLLAATIKDQEIIYHHKIPVDCENCLLFYKIPKIGNQFQDVSLERPTIGILSLEGGMVKSIYNSVSRIFSPNLLSQRSTYTPEIAKILENLQTSLSASLGLPESGILSVHDEVNYWNQKSINSPTKSDKDKAKTFASLLEKIDMHLREADNTKSLNTLEEFLDQAHNILDEIWRLPNHYPQNRMADIMDVVCANIIDNCIENLSGEDIWNLTSIHISTTMSQIYDISDNWIQICDSLTRLFWPNYNQHPWIGKPHTPRLAVSFKKRLDEIKNIKNLYKQIITLFHEDNNFMNTINQMFRPFRDINLFDTYPVGEKRWQTAMIQFENILEPIDENIANMLKAKLHNNLDNPRQVIHIFSKFDIISTRPMVMELLTAEREHFLQSLQSLVKDLQVALTQTGDSSYDNSHISAICWECRWLKIVDHQINEINKISNILTKRDDHEEVFKQLADLKVETQNLLKLNFDTWCEQSISAVKTGELTLRDDKPVVEFEKSGRQLMRVTFNAKLISFCYDVREFENLGFRVPIELRESASHAVKFMSYARLLQQVATFHNTIGDRMILCQRPIMLKNAVELSNLVRSESVAWNDEESVKRYVSVLQNAVNKLSKDNALLAGYHEQVKRTVIKLMATDLLRQGQIWKDEMRHLRDIIATLESQGYTNLQAFKLHWDYQLYKVLEYQYVSGLLNINHKLPDIYIDIVFRQQQLQFKPSIEEIRAKYYSQLRRFLERPLGFRGLSDQSQNLFKVMVERNRHYFGSLYKKAEDLFKELNRHKDVWISWVALGCVDLEQLCKVHLITWEDWDRNFRACKHFSQQVAKIQSSEERLDCFVINLSPLRSDIEFISRRFWEILTNSLRSSILENIVILQEFLQTSLQVLQNVPFDENGISEAGAKYEKITNELPKMSDLLKTVQGKDTCLAGWCKERVTALSNILLKWDQLQPLIDNHHAVLQRQIDIKKDHIAGQIGNLNEEAEKFLIRWEATLAELEANENADLNVFRERQQQWIGLKEKKDQLVLDCEKFNVEFPADVDGVFSKVENDVKILGEQWQHYENFMKEFDDIVAEEWSVYRRRPYILTDFLNKWKSSSTIPITSATTRIHQMIEKYHSVLPILQHLQSDALSEKHWAKIFFMLGQLPKPYHDILLKDIILSSEKLSQQATEIQNIVRQASSEQIVRQALTELDQWGVTAVLKLTAHTDSKGQILSLIKDFQEVLNKIGDNQCLLQSAKNSAAFEAFSDQAEIWEGRLNSLDHMLTSLNQIQRKWIYLEPIFGAGTLRNEEAVFMRIDKDFRYIMREIGKDSRILSICKINNISSIIDSLENQLSRCQNTLTTYITSKRNAFPRFYFLGDDDLLEILGQASKEEIIQKHIKKLFPGVHRLGITAKENINLITSIHSGEGDNLRLINIIPINGPVEEWLNQLVVEIKFTLKDLVKKCSVLEVWEENHVNMYPIQVICLAKSILFTKQTERAITSMSLQKQLKDIRDEIEKYTSINARTKDNLLQIKIRAILLDLVHHATVVEYLIQHNVTNHQDWHWVQQLKFYIDKNSTAICRMVYAEFEYSYEYLGNANKLVNTSLTHKCYLTLTQAMHLGLGGNPFGPAGTGKTECVKALGAMLGRLVLVFNCNENIDSAAMGLILSGLARCGAWGCFDEFNRLQEATLSAISMQIQPLQLALKEKQEMVTVLDEPIPLNPHCGIFVTLNPAGEEYGGRQKLPGNIQSLFRPIVMQEPEPREIARVLLFVEGFKNADQIGERMVELFSLAGKMLSPQRHYDWGLRELKTVLTACGKSLREHDDTPTPQEEIELAVAAVRSNTMSKLTLADCRRFDMLITDVLPNVSLRTSRQDELKAAVEGTFTSLGYISNQRQVEKCLELYEQLLKRMGVIIVGPPSSGKTTLIAILKQALSSMSKVIRTYTIAPKSMTRIQLLGKLDPDTRQWNDGVLTTTAVAVNSEDAGITSWIICDGDIDPEWIEALNSILDDNRLLTLPSGWRIQFGDNVNFIFETHDLQHASPATISRMGIINLSSKDLPETLIVESWIQKQMNSDILQRFIELYFTRAFNWIEKNSTKNLQMSKISLVKCGLQALGNSNSKEDFCVSLFRGFGAILSPDIKNKFAKIIFEMADIYLPNSMEAEFSYYNSFRDIIEIFDIDHRTDYYQDGMNTLVKTPTIRAHLEVLKNFFKGDDRPPFLIVGPAGSGKTLLLQNVISEYSGYQLIVINCSAQLTANYILYILKQNCLVISGIRGREYKPKFTRIVLFLKNLDLCPVDSWGTSDVVELLLQLIHRNGFYSDTLEWISVSGLQLCGSMVNNSKHPLSPRLMSVTRLLVIGYPNETDMNIIVQGQFGPIFNRFKTSVNSAKMERNVDAIISVYTETKNNFSIEQRTHYVFTPKMVMKLISNLEYYPEDYLVQALIYEMKRIFKDRLINEDDTTRFEEILVTNTRAISSVHDKSTHYFIPSASKSSYLHYTSEEEFSNMVQKSIAICNTEDILIDIAVTPEFMNAVASLCRAFSRPKTNLVICGQAGSGRREALHIACSLLNIKICTLQPAKSYGINDFYNDLKMAMQSAALEEQNTILLIDHAWVQYLPKIMEPIEAILEGSEIPDLFGDDLETVANPLRNAAQLEGYQESLASYFLKRVKKNLHLSLCLESSSTDTSELFSQYPALYRNTEIVWMLPLSNRQLEDIPSKILEQIKPDNSPVTIPKYLSEVVATTGKWANSPQRLMELIKSHCCIYEEYSNRIHGRMENLTAGVDKLSSAHAVVATLKTEAKKQEEALNEKRKLAAQSLDLISATMRNATDQRTDLLELKKKTQESSEKLMERKKAIEIELQEVEPLLREASAAVGQIKSEALAEIRSLRAPPDTIRDILEGVLRLMGIRDTSWNSMKTFLSKRGVKEDIRSLDPARISPENCQAVEKLLDSKSESFEMKNAKRASAAAAPLASWVIANVQYSKVMQSIKPLEREQNELKRNLDEAETQMKSLMTGLDDVDARVKELSNQLNVYTQEAAVLEIKLEDVGQTLKSAENLVEKLSSEYKSWSEQLEEYKEDLISLQLKSFLISLTITYLTHLILEERVKYFSQISQMIDIPFINIDKELITDQDKIHWESMGLTSDTQSMQNAALVKKILTLSFRSVPIPFLLDPSGCSFKWLQNYLTSSSKSYDVVSQTSDRFSYILELAVRFGKILIVQDVQSFVPSLLSAIISKIHIRFNKKLLQVGNKLIDLHDEFKLVLVTTHGQMSLATNIEAYITSIPFTTTVSGLTDQLMSKCILLKRPELEEKRINLLQNEGQLWKQRVELQDKLLHELSTAHGDILKNEKLISTLNAVKESSESIDASLKESNTVRNKLMEDFNQFRQLCLRSTTFYIGILRIYHIPATMFSLIFTQVLANERDYDEQEIFSKLVRQIYQKLSRSIPKANYLNLALHICKNAYPEKVPEKEWESFITNFMSTEDSSGHAFPQWIKKELIPKMTTLKSIHPNLYQSLQLEKENIWRNYMKSSGKTELPVTVTDFQKILITQILRPDLMTSVMQRSATKILGFSNLAVAQPNIQQLAEESISQQPILIITSSGSDPSTDLKKHATEKIGANRYVEISIGKGQEQQVVSTVRKSIESGNWICIKNIHLVPDLIKNLDIELSKQDLNKDFRLWLICETITGISDSFKTKCLKILYELPNGVKYKVQSFLRQWEKLILTKRDPKLMKLYFILFLFNAILQERCSYIPQGFTKWYDFGDSDLRAAIDFITWMEKTFALKMEWPILQGLFENVAFGGRIDNVQDHEILLHHLVEFFNANTMINRWTPLKFPMPVPQSHNIQDYYSYVNSMPDTDKPEYFGLAPSTNVSRDLLFCRNLLKQLRSKYFQTDDQENLDKRIRPILSLWRKLVGGTTIIETYETLHDMEETSNPWRAFILSELRLAGQLFQTIHRSLAALHNTIKEIATMSKDEKYLMQILCENQVPLRWRKLWSGPKLATDFMKAITVRGIEAEKRFKNSPFNELFCDNIDFSHIFNVDGFLAALKLTNARQLSLSTCELILDTNFNENILNNNYNKNKLKNNISVHVAPVHIDGAQFRDGKIFINGTIDDYDNNSSNLSHVTESDLENKTSSFYITYVTPNMATTNLQHVTDNVILNVPLYSNMTRERLICTIQMPFTAEKSSIIYSGTALIVQDTPFS